MYYHGSRARHNQVTPQYLGSEGVYSRAILPLDRYDRSHIARMSLPLSGA